MYVHTPRFCSAYRHSSLSTSPSPFFRRPLRQPLWWGRVLASPPEPSVSPLLRPRLFVSQAVKPTALVGPCACFTTCALLRRCFVHDCLFRRPWRQPLWWGRVLASPPEPSASPLLRLRLFVSQAVDATTLWDRTPALPPEPSASLLPALPYTNVLLAQARRWTVLTHPLK